MFARRCLHVKWMYVCVCVLGGLDTHISMFLCIDWICFQDACFLVHNTETYLVAAQISVRKLGSLSIQTLVFPYGQNDIGGVFLMHVSLCAGAQHFLTGSMAGMTSVAVTYPLDLIRTRMAGRLCVEDVCMPYNTWCFTRALLSFCDIVLRQFPDCDSDSGWGISL